MDREDHHSVPFTKRIPIERQFLAGCMYSLVLFSIVHSLIHHPRFKNVIGPSRYHNRQRVMHVQGRHKMAVGILKGS